MCGGWWYAQDWVEGGGNGHGDTVANRKWPMRREGGAVPRGFDFESLGLVER